MLDPFLIRGVIAIIAYFLFNLLIGALVKDAKAQQIFQVILIICCVIYWLLGSFLPFK